MSSFDKTDDITEEISRFVLKIRKDIEFKVGKEKIEDYEKEEYENFIEELIAYSSKTPMLGKRRHHDVKYLKKTIRRKKWNW